MTVETGAYGKARFFGYSHTPRPEYWKFFSASREKLPPVTRHCLESENIANSTRTHLLTSKVNFDVYFSAAKPRDLAPAMRCASTSVNGEPKMRWQSSQIQQHSSLGRGKLINPSPTEEDGFARQRIEHHVSEETLAAFRKFLKMGAPSVLWAKNSEGFFVGRH